ncbi:hypothetical protein P3S67_018202 [Capsicum chacoense]
MLLELLKETLPADETLPKSYYDAKNMLQGLGLGYISIYDYKNNCVLYWFEYKDRQECPHCGTLRWKINNGRDKRIPHKVLLYFPLKPILQRLFMSSKISMYMRCIKEKRLDEVNVLRHPTDSDAWKEFDKNHKWFAQEPRNIRLGLATDGFNPYGHMSTSYKLWSEGVEAFDASAGECFKMHVAVLWTINDFPAYEVINYKDEIAQGYLMDCIKVFPDEYHLGIRSGNTSPTDKDLKKSLQLFVLWINCPEWKSGWRDFLKMEDALVDDIRLKPETNSDAPGDVQRVHLLDGTIGRVLLKECFQRDGVGKTLGDLYEGSRMARVSDFPRIKKLLQSLEGSRTLIRRTDEELVKALPPFVIMEREGHIIACATLVPYFEEKYREVAATAVSSDYLSQGHGDKLLGVQKSAL